MQMGDGHKIYGKQLLSKGGRALLHALFDTVDEARYEVRPSPNRQVVGKRITIDDFAWTWQEVETAFINGTKAAKAIPDKERRLLYGAITSQPDVRQSFADIAGALADDDTNEDALKGKFTIEGYRFSSPPHHIDLFGDIVLWACWIPLATNRNLVWSVIAQKASGRISADWAKVQNEMKMNGMKSDTLSRRYRRVLVKLAEKLTSEKFPRRRV